RVERLGANRLFAKDLSREGDRDGVVVVQSRQVSVVADGIEHAPSGAGSLRGRTVDRPLVLTVHLAAGGRDHDLAGPRIQNAALAERTVQSLYGLDELRAVDRKSVVAGKRVSAVGAHEIAPQSES